MEAQFEWRDEFNIGVEVIDKEHQRLFTIINKLYKFKEEEKDNQWTCQEGIKFFKGHTLRHFAEEEEYMRSICYPGLEQHKKIHNDFRENTIPALEQELERTNYSTESLNHFLGVCAGWLIGHTLTEDRAITGQGDRKWDNLLPGEELNAMKKVILQLMFDMFRLESQLISDTYGGEKFGRGVYYRLEYGHKDDNIRQEVILVFEEKLLISTIGKILGFKSNKLDNMLIHAARYTARQFVQRFMEQFPSLATYVLKEESLLSYNQFQKLLAKEQLQVSMLFNTGGLGYFAFCLIAPHLLETNIGRAKESEQNMDQVDQYLDSLQKQTTDAMDELNKLIEQRRQLRANQAAKASAGDVENYLAIRKQQADNAMDDLDRFLAIRKKQAENAMKELEQFLASHRQQAEQQKQETLPNIVTDNAIDEVNKYVTSLLEEERKEEIANKRKILVVDDSLTIRKSMEKLLANDYNVSVVESGVAAIRAITLNRPDLVLLDYDMPICDGRQTLAMFRSDKNFADIPVIFLTGRNDPKSVQQVMSLQPAGYLLKHLNQLDLKSKIDSFFAQQAAAE